jgi:hypothetical protein
MVKCSPNTLKPGMTHVSVGPDNCVLKGFADEQLAKDDAAERNAKSTKLGLKSRYTVASVKDVEK